MTTRVLLVDDHRIVREGLRALLGDKLDLDIVGEAVDGREAVALALELTPDVVLMDVAMRGMNGIEATRQIVSARPQTRVLALSMHNDGRFVGEMLRAGARKRRNASSAVSRRPGDGATSGCRRHKPGR